MYVHGASAFACDPIDELDDLKNVLKGYTDYSFRRINKFILLALTGAHRCLHGRKYDSSIAVYLATENGNLGDTENVLAQIYNDNSFPKPFNFINTMSNTASFYVAQSLKTIGRSITVSSKYASFERGLELALADLELGQVREVLVGGVDEAVAVRERVSEKYHPSYRDVKLVEGSSWIHLSSEAEGAIGTIVGVKTFQSRKDALDWCRTPDVPITLAFGIFIEPSEKDEWMREAGEAEEFSYLSEIGYNDSAAAFAVAAFFEQRKKGAFFHIGKTPQRNYLVIGCRSDE